MATRNIYLHTFIVFFICFFFYLCFSTFYIYIYLYLYLFYSLLHNTIKKLNLYHYNLNVSLLYCYKKNSYLHIIAYLFLICYFQLLFYYYPLSYINVILQYSAAHSTYLCFVDCRPSNYEILEFVIGV